MRKHLIIGGSIAGLFAGVLLRRLGHDVDIYERAGTALASRGAGITTHDELYDALTQAGVDIRGEVAIESRGRVMLDHQGTELGSLEMPQLMTSWGLLYRLLRNAFPDAHYHSNADLAAVEQHASGITARFADGRTACADFLIGADGSQSTVRALCMPEASLRYAGYAAWRGLAHERDLPPAAHAALVDRFTLCLPPHEHMLGYMVAGPDDCTTPGGRYYNWVWYRPAPAATVLRDLLTGSDGEYYPGGIPHHLIRPEHVDTLRCHAEQHIAPPLRAALNATPTPFLQPIQELASTRIRAERVVLIGDAAFTARPHVGLGVSKAASDAATLARAMASDDHGLDAALNDWQRLRLAFGQAIVAHSAKLGCYLESREVADPDGLAEQTFYRSPEVVLARIAARDPGAFL